MDFMITIMMTKKIIKLEMQIIMEIKKKILKIILIKQRINLQIKKKINMDFTIITMKKINLIIKMIYLPTKQIIIIMDKKIQKI